MKKRALITGVTGQDGSYLSELLLDKGYEVHGLVRRSSVMTTERIAHLIHGYADFHLHEGDLADATSLDTVLRSARPDEIYNLGGMSDVATSFKMPKYCLDVNAAGPVHLMASALHLNKDVRFYQAGTSELYGGIPGSDPQSEKTPFYPKSPYATAKLAAYWSVLNYRESYGLHASNGILYNHESPRRGEMFVTRKITKTVAEIAMGTPLVLSLGNLDTKRDWGYAPEFCEAMMLMLQQPSPSDYVIATGETHTVRDFVELAFKHADICIEWKNRQQGTDEEGVDRKTGRTLIRVDPKFMRPNEVYVLRGNPTKAQQALRWRAKTSMADLVGIMMKYDLAHATKH